MKEEKLWRQFLETDDNGKPVLAKSPIAGISRRSFLAALGYTAAGLSLMSCRVPEQKIIPYLDRPPEFTPGTASWYASTCSGCSAGCGVLVKVRDGRPIKLEGNPDHPVNKGGLCSIAHSLVFSLYDSERLKGPLADGKSSGWKDIDASVTGKLADIKKDGGKIAFVSNTIISPTSRSVIAKFLEGFGDSRHVVYEPVSVSAIRLAHKRSHGAPVLPTYRFEKARAIVSFDADFLGTWISPVQYTRGYSAGRDLKNGQPEMSRHLQFESRMSLTGANADERFGTTSVEQVRALLQLAKEVSDDGDGPSGDFSSLRKDNIGAELLSAVKTAAADLLGNKGRSLVVSGSNDTDIQQLVNFINERLGNYGQTIDLGAVSHQSQGDESDFQDLIGEMNAGEIAAVFMLDVNPAYDSPSADGFIRGLKKVPLKVSFGRTLDETSSLADLVCPDHHFLEAWNDAEPISGTYSFNQPTIAPLFKTRAYQESILKWSGDERSFYDALRTSWEETLFTKQDKIAKFDDFWDKSLHDGVFAAQTDETAAPLNFTNDGFEEALKNIASTGAKGYTLVLYQKPSIRDGRFAGSPWLQELPDPLTKTTWDNYACLSKSTAEKLGLKEGRIVSLKKDGRTIELPVMIQPGQSDDCIAVAVGYGRTRAGAAATGVGANAYPFAEFKEGTLRYSTSNVVIEPTPGTVTFAKTQITDSAITGASKKERTLVEELTLAEFVSGNHHIKQTEFEKLFAAHEYPDHKWGMAVDLAACTGCNSCVLSCQAENNSPVVGKAEVRRMRDLQWLRIDRYYKERDGKTKTQFQPLPCMQCENASCEMVCPVLATVHSSDGLNMQVYNRCVGTRYCANNCAYKVRHFNWFAYPHEDQLANLALNPDVTVRTRGVMEKCTFCVQRIEEKKILARNEGRPIRDGEIQTACQQSCPADAIIFGDMKDLKSRVNAAKKSGRNYTLLEDLNTKPAVTYLADVKNVEAKEEEHE